VNGQKNVAGNITNFLFHSIEISGNELGGVALSIDGEYI
jgi:hypothetical protein